MLAAPGPNHLGQAFLGKGSGIPVKDQEKAKEIPLSVARSASRGFCLSLPTPVGSRAQDRPQLPHSSLWMSSCHMGISKSLGFRAKKQNLGRPSACLCWKGHAWIFFLAKPLKKMQLKTKIFFDLQNQPCALANQRCLMNSLSAEVDWSG